MKHLLFAAAIACLPQWVVPRAGVKGLAAGRAAWSKTGAAGLAVASGAVIAVHVRGAVPGPERANRVRQAGD